LKEFDIQYVRKKLYVTDEVPALSVDPDLYVRCGLSQKMDDNDMLILGLVMSMKNHKWRDAQIAKVRKRLEGATTPTSRITRAFDMITGEP